MKKHSFSKKVLSMVLAVSILITLLPFENIFAEWTTPNNIIINDLTGSGDVRYFVNQFGEPQITNQYYVAGQANTIAYCIDAEAAGPGGTAYAINDSAIDATFRNGLARIAQYGYPTNSWTTHGISAAEAQYATQAAMHWWENAVFGGTEGWVRAGVQNNGCPTNYLGTLGYADWLLGLAGIQTSPSLFVRIDPRPSAWSAGSPPTSTFTINGYDCDTWAVTLPAGVTYGGNSTFTGLGNATVTVQLTDSTAFAAGSKKVTAQGFSNRTEGQIHYYVAGGFQNMVVYQQSVSAAGDPDAQPFGDAAGTLSLYKQTEWTTGVYSSEAGATFQILNSASAVVATIITDASGNASVSLPYGAYTIRQLSGPGYTVNTSDQAYTVSASSPTATFTNTPFTGQIEVNKTYAAVTGTVAEGGAVFQIFPLNSSYAAAGDYQRDQITTNSSGYAISKSLPYGTYTLVQIAAPIGSQINGSSWTFELGVDGSTFINGDIDTVNISNTPNYGYLQINKTSLRGTNVAESGASFDVYLTSAGSYAAANVAEKDQITTNAAGTATSKALPYGSYTVHQTGIPAGTKAAADFTVTIGAVNGATIATPLTNQVYWGSVTIDKSLSYGGVTSDEGGAVFQIYNSAYASYAEAPDSEKDQITTNAAGDASSKSLPYGTYTIRQTVAPAGAQLNAGTWSVVLGSDGAQFIDDDVDVQAITDQPTMNRLEILKTTARATNVAETGAQFQVWNANYASYADAPVAYRDILITDTTGYDISVLLPYGTYTVHQTVAPAGTKAVADFTVALTSVNGTVIHRDLSNNTYWGQAEINKTTSFGGNVKLEAGAVFQVYLTSAGSYTAAAPGERDQITTNASGHAITKLLPYGSYTAVQLSSPTGAQINMGSWSFVLGLDATYVDNDVDTQAIADLPTFGKLEINKTTNRGHSVAEAGASFEVYATEYGSYAAALTDYKTTITTNAAGYAITGDLPYGVYTVHQTVVPAGTKVAADITVTLGTTHGATVHLDLVNQVYWGRAEINKTTELAGNVKLEAGATFQIYNTAYDSYADAPEEEKDTITTDANGHAISKLLPYGTYTASQTVIPSGAQINTGTWTFILGIDDAAYVNNDVDTQNIVNLPTFGQLDLSKTTNRGFSVDEAGATFEIYCTEYLSFAAAPAEYKDTITTDINGDAITKLLPYGDYSVHQSVLPAGTKTVADYTVSLKIAQGAVVHQNLVNETFWGDIQVLKYKSAPSSTSGILTPEADATFRIYPSEFATWDAALAALPADQELVLTDEITTDMGGIAKTNHQLPYGEYTVEQIDTIANLTTFKVDAWQVFIGAVDNQTYTYVRNNEIYEQYLAIIKTDAETGQVIRMAGATFQILAADGLTVLTDSNGDNLFETDANGRIDIKDLALQVGNYYIKETVAPMGYALNTTPKAFAVSIADHGSSIVTIDYGVDIRSEPFADTAQTCQLVVEKKGDTLTGATKVDTGYMDRDGNDLLSYAFSYGTVGKAGAVFEVFVGTKDIGDNAGLLKTFDVDGDGVKETSLTAGTSLGMITTAAVTQSDGSIKYIASLDGLPLDATTGTAQYVVKEVTAPTGDLINPETLTYNFAFADQTIAQIDQEQSITDARQKVQLTVEKQKEAAVWNETTQSFDWPLIAAPEILFGLYTATDILAPDKSVLVAADTLVDVMLTDADGNGATTQDLPMGSYYAKELKVTEDVVYDGTTTYPVTCAPTSNQTIVTAVYALNNGDPIINLQISGVMEVLKLSGDTNLPMQNVEFGVYDSLGKFVDTLTTDATGQAETIRLPLGVYTVREIHTLPGYLLADDVVFTVDDFPEAGDTYALYSTTITDSAQVINLAITKNGDGLVSVTQTDALDKDGKVLIDRNLNPIRTYEFNYSTVGLAGAAFDVSVGSSNILDHQGNVRMFDTDGDGTAETAMLAGTYLGSIVTDAAGHASMEGLPFDSVTGTAQYIAIETTTPSGYLNDAAEIVFDLTANTTTPTVSNSQIVPNPRQTLSIALTKEKDAGTFKPVTQKYDWNLVPAEGIVFGLYTKNDILAADGTVLIEADTLVDVLQTGANGKATTEQDLPFGDYYAKELKVTEDVVYDGTTTYPISCVPSGTSSALAFVLNDGEPIFNRLISGTMVIYKIAADTQIPMSGVVFEVYDADANLVDTITTDVTGHGETIRLPFGVYTIREIHTLPGYLLADDMVFNVDDVPAAGETYTEYSTTITDPAQVIDLTITKNGDGLISVTQTDALDKDGKVLIDRNLNPIRTYEFTYSTVGLSGTAFDVSVGSSNILDHQGNVRMFDTDGDGTAETAMLAGTYLGSIVTDAAGHASMKGLPFDSITGTAQYTAIETTTPSGYLNDSAELVFDLTANGTTPTVSNSQIVPNSRQTLSIALTKEKDAGTWNPVTQKYDWTLVPAEEIVFGLYTKNDIRTAGGSVVIAADTLVDVLQTGTNGKATTEQDLPFGDYYAKELIVTKDVIYDPIPYPISCVPSGTSSALAFVLNDGEPIFNRQIAGTMEIYKLAADTQLPMEGVVFEVYDKDANLVDTVTTGSDGQAKTIVLPYGTYHLIETHTLSSYSLSGKIDFSIYISPTADMDISEDEITILNYLIPVTTTPIPTPTPTPAPTGILGVFRESVSKTGEQGGNKIAAGALLLLLFLTVRCVLRRRRHLDEEK